jgi:membrane protein
MNEKLSRFAWKIISDWSFSLSALIAYYLLISLLPLIVSMFAVVGLIFGENDKFQHQIRDRLVKAFPEPGLSEVIDSVLNSLAQQAGLLFVLSFVVALFTGSRLFIGFDDVLTIIYRIRERKVVEQNMLAIKMIVAFVTIMPFIIICSSIPAIMQRQESFYQWLTVLVGGLFAFLFFQLIYLILPKRRMTWKHT